MEKITSEPIKQPSERSTRHGPKKITVVVAVIVTILAVLAVFIYVIFFEFPAPSMYQRIGTIKDSTATATTWAVSQIFTSDRGPISKSDVYVTLKNASGFIMQNESLAAASGTHGFLYQPVNAGDYISLGDVFSLSKNYQQGSSIELTTWDAKGQYAFLSV
jgi:FlaG/FlaF family flagellin (archaellin)